MITLTPYAKHLHNAAIVAEFKGCSYFADSVRQLLAKHLPEAIACDLSPPPPAARVLSQPPRDREESAARAAAVLALRVVIKENEAIFSRLAVVTEKGCQDLGELVASANAAIRDHRKELAEVEESIQRNARALAEGESAESALAGLRVKRAQLLRHLAEIKEAAEVIGAKHIEAVFAASYRRKVVEDLARLKAQLAEAEAP